MAMSPNCVDTEQIPSKMVAGDREILGIGENPKSFGESRINIPCISRSGLQTADNDSVLVRAHTTPVKVIEDWHPSLNLSSFGLTTPRFYCCRGTWVWVNLG